MARRALVIGASGFLGGGIARSLANQGFEVVGVGRRALPPFAFGGRYHALALPSGALDALTAEVRPDVAVLAMGAANPAASLTDPAGDFLAGPPVVFNALNAIRTSTPKCRTLLLSSAAVYGQPGTLPVSEDAALRPLSPYGYHKWQAELLLQEFHQLYGIPAAALRVFSAYGRGFRRQVVWDIVRRARSEAELVLHGTGEETRDFIEADDVAAATAAVLERGELRGESYNVASGVETSIRELAERIFHTLGRSATTRFTGVVQSGTPHRWRADMTKLRRLGFEPAVSLDEGLRRVVRWYEDEANS